jgi:hypothetical protein
MFNPQHRVRARTRRVIVLVMLLALGAFLELHARSSASPEVRVSTPALQSIARDRPLLRAAIRESEKREKREKARERRQQFIATVAKRVEYERLVAKAQREQTWDELARCESGGNWSVVDRYGGGLGIYLGTWQGFGGEEFASNPGYATKEQQIIVAERIYARYGFDGWGCAHNMGWMD